MANLTIVVLGLDLPNLWQSSMSYFASEVFIHSKISINLSSKISSPTVEGIPWISRLFLLFYWSNLLKDFSLSASFFSGNLTLAWRILLSSLKAVIIESFTLKILSFTYSVMLPSRLLSIWFSLVFMFWNFDWILFFKLDSNELKSLLKSWISCLISPSLVLWDLTSSLNHWFRNITCYTMVNISANITRKYTSIITEGEQLPKPINLHQHIKPTILLTYSYNHTHNITFLILLLKKKGRVGQKMATLSQWLIL